MSDTPPTGDKTDALLKRLVRVPKKEVERERRKKRPKKKK